MAYEYQIDTARGVILEQWSGTVTLHELMECHREQASDPAYCVDLVGLVDFTEACLHVSPTDMRRMVEFADASKTATKGRWALLAPGDLEYGLSRMYKALTNGRRDIQVFRSRDEALAWLGSPAVP